MNFKDGEPRIRGRSLTIMGGGVAFGSVGSSGGILILWDKRVWEGEFVESGEQCITCKKTLKLKKTNIYSCIATLQHKFRPSFLVSQRQTGPCSSILPSCWIRRGESESQKAWWRIIPHCIWLDGIVLYPFIFAKEKGIRPAPIPDVQTRRKKMKRPFYEEDQTKSQDTCTYLAIYSLLPKHTIPSPLKEPITILIKLQPIHSIFREDSSSSINKNISIQTKDSYKMKIAEIYHKRISLFTATSQKEEEKITPNKKHFELTLSQILLVLDCGKYKKTFHEKGKEVACSSAKYLNLKEFVGPGPIFSNSTLPPDMDQPENPFGPIHLTPRPKTNQNHLLSLLGHKSLIMRRPESFFRNQQMR
ncbi:hypothetical protein H5410_057040 [Solanum commersonii]|uniref:Uncharacterized protein n=1 Tax=Solanum commersonii TaxID=4109 RepID=A0A9J5WMY9_SOLCO|nr:hypothetical protein H5410_057040 [Solanum commersonii]